jgi:hypothetical protein
VARLKQVNIAGINDRALTKKMESITKTSKASAARLVGRAPVSVWLVEDNHTFRDTIARRHDGRRRA